MQRALEPPTLPARRLRPRRGSRRLLRMLAAAPERHAGGPWKAADHARRVRALLGTGRGGGSAALLSRLERRAADRALHPGVPPLRRLDPADARREGGAG